MQRRCASMPTITSGTRPGTRTPGWPAMPWIRSAAPSPPMISAARSARSRSTAPCSCRRCPASPETREFLDLAAATGFVHGVVGWVDLTSPSVADDLDALLDGPAGRWLVGIRHQVHDEPDPDWLARADVHRGLAAVQARGLAYDLLVRARELPAAVDTVRAFPGLRFVLDHIAKPRIADGRDDPWSQRMPALAAQPNVAVKLSGMVTEADWATWSPGDLRPFVSEVAAWFGVERLMFGSDWPVCLLAGSYHAVLGGPRRRVARHVPGRARPVLGLNAVASSINSTRRRVRPRPGSGAPTPGICQRLRAAGIDGGGRARRLRPLQVAVAHAAPLDERRLRPGNELDQGRGLGDHRADEVLVDLHHVAGVRRDPQTAARRRGPLPAAIPSLRPPGSRRPGRRAAHPRK